MKAPLIIAVTALTLAACGAKPTAAADAKAVGAKAAGAAFLADNRKQAGVVTTPSGLEYRILKSGPVSGLHPKPADEVKVDYDAKLLDGTVVDSSFDRGSPAVLTVRDLIPGWREALQLMRPGDDWLLYVPAKLAYGDQATGPIPAGSVLQFHLHLIAIAPDSSSVGAG
jgi:peptidylprolyl isomerase/FKBP-type peptidyl-prolyl cis-trans isomerase FklB